ncbi:MinD/ParA family ATP-binding protein [Actinomycetospora soli]|uniref:MinD/ParA family ATP-binding protein n=1 Tax=Actinomycetospora soli TaxID=2893887 RepID=UPI001E446A35|nr:MinD/ParA family protein [Actinomycetospora soli]MCD2191311.1 MinD/ParA family protein [Actinomycetospora soli]
MTTARSSEQHTNGHPVTAPGPRWDPFDPPAAEQTAADPDQTPVAPESAPGPATTGSAPLAGSVGEEAEATQHVAQEPPRTPEPDPNPGSGSTATAGDLTWGGPGEGVGLRPGDRSGDRPLDAELSSAALLRPTKDVPRTGWRAALYALTGGLVNPGASEADRARALMVERVNQRLAGCYRVAAVSVKGGVGKTSTTALLGSAFASLRGDRVIALDANPDRGNLAEKLPSETTATVRHLLADAAQIRTVSDIRAYTSQSKARLEVLASESDPATSEAFSAADYHAAIDLLSTHYNIILTDCGTGLLHSALQAAVEVADSLLIITSASIDGARSAKATMEWLEAHGHRELVARSVTVITGVGARNHAVDLDTVERFFASHTRAVIRVPFDPHLADGAEIDLETLAPRTRDAVLELAALVADDFARPGRLDHHRRRTPALLPGTTTLPGTGARPAGPADRR